MKRVLLNAGSLALLMVLGCAHGVETCPPQAKQINDSNSVVLLGGTAQGPIKQVVVGEFGKDVNQQKRLLGQFDRCGALIRADISYDKNEGNMMLKVVQSITRVADGWQSVYDLSVFVLKEGQPVEVNRKQGRISFLTSKKGVIASSSDAFLLKGEKGFTETTNTFDAKQRLIKSVARGSDDQANGVVHYQWNNRNQLIASQSENSKLTWLYDKNHRETGLKTLSHSARSDLTVIDECQLWDTHNNCTLSYSREKEVFPEGEVVRNISAASRYEYWE